MSLPFQTTRLPSSPQPPPSPPPHHLKKAPTKRCAYWKISHLTQLPCPLYQRYPVPAQSCSPCFHYLSHEGFREHRRKRERRGAVLSSMNGSVRKEDESCLVFQAEKPMRAYTQTKEPSSPGLLHLTTSKKRDKSCTSLDVTAGGRRFLPRAKTFNVPNVECWCYTRNKNAL